MPTLISDTGLAWLATVMAAQSVIVSAHTDDPGAALADNELPTGGGRNYARHTVPAAQLTATASATRNPALIRVFTPNDTDIGAGAAPVVRYLGYRIDLAIDVIYGRARLVAPITLVSGVDFEIAPNTLDLMFANKT